MALLSDSDFLAIVGFIKPHLASAESHVDRLKQLARADETGVTDAQLRYYRNYASACRHLLAIASQKQQGGKNEPQRDSGYAE